MLEKCVAAIRKPATQFTLIADSDGFTFRHMSRVKGMHICTNAYIYYSI